MSTLYNVAAALPPFTDDPRDRLAHTLAAYATAEDDRYAIHATQNALGPGVKTGLTYGDLRAILRRLDGEQP